MLNSLIFIPVSFKRDQQKQNNKSKNKSVARTLDFPYSTSRNLSWLKISLNVEL